MWAFSAFRLLPYVFGAVLFYGVYAHYKSVVNENAVLSENNQTLTAALAEERNALVDAQLAAETHKRALSDLESEIARLQEALEAARKQKREINEIFAKHDFSMLAYKKPGLVSNRVNAGTQRLFDAFETATQASGDRSPAD